MAKNLRADEIKVASELVLVLQAHIKAYGDFPLVVSSDAEGNSFHPFGRFEVGESDNFFLYPSDKTVEAN